jgi:hypothetical protein
MARTTSVFSLEHVAKRIGENVELLEEVCGNSENIDYGEMISVHSGAGESTTTLTERGIECLQDLLADIRTWEGGIRQFLIHERCDSEMIERVMADEPKA